MIDFYDPDSYEEGCRTKHKTVAYYKDVAKQLGYDRSVIAKLEKAKDDREISMIMYNARHKRFKDY